MKDQATKEMINAIKAGYTYFYVQSYEMEQHVEEMSQAILEYNESSEKNDFSTYVWDNESNPDPESIMELLDSDKPEVIVSIAKNLDWYLTERATNDLNKDFVQWLQNRAETFTTREKRRVLIIVGSDPMEVALPSCLMKYFMELNFDLPSIEKINEIYNFIDKSAQNNPRYVEPNEDEKELILRNSQGLTVREIKNAYAYTLVKNEGKFSSKTVGEIQAREVEKTAGLVIGEYPDIEEPLGLDNIKSFFINTFKSKHSKGLMLLGPPGTGKSHLAKWFGKVSGRKVIEQEMAELFGGLVGESEKKMKQALDIIRANCPCILFIDEIEKGLAGVNSKGQGDGGTTKRSMSQFLKFLSDKRPEGLYVIATCNDISALPPEYVRAERWDTAPFFIDLPNDSEKQAILDFYKEEFEVEGELKNSEGWSGAELKSVCRIAAMMKRKLQDVVRFIVPVSKTMAKEIDSLRTWAENKTIPASTPYNGDKKKKNSRSVDF